MIGKRSGKGSAANSATERLGKSTEPAKDPTHCDSCGKPLGMWFSLAEKAYCSPCFHEKFWTPFQSVPSKAR